MSLFLESSPIFGSSPVSLNSPAKILISFASPVSWPGNTSSSKAGVSNKGTQSFGFVLDPKKQSFCGDLDFSTIKKDLEDWVMKEGEGSVVNIYIYIYIYKCGSCMSYIRLGD